MGANVEFCKLVPGGNATILLTNPRIAPEELPFVAASLMHPMHIQAEQVGALFTANTTPHLQMMGGEFCVNATRSAALLLAHQGRLAPLAEGCWQGLVTVSGMADPIQVLVSLAEDDIGTGLRLCQEVPYSPNSLRVSPPVEKRLFCAARIPCGAGLARLIPHGVGLTVVHIPGISHLLVDAAVHPMPLNWRQGAAAFRLQAGLSTAPASGVVWYQKEAANYRIWPAVAVQATRSEHLETACGSASVAICLLHHSMQQDPRLGIDADTGFQLPRPGAELAPSVAVVQPSGETLNVTLQTPAEQPCEPAYAWVAGAVCLVAEGTAYVV